MLQALHSPKITGVVLITWLVALSWVIVMMSISNSDFPYFRYFRYGPNDSASFLGLSMGSWREWGSLFAFSVLTQAAKVYADETIGQWIVNVVTDHKEDLVEKYGYWEAQFICVSYYSFSAAAKVVQIGAVLAQIDFALAFMLTDVAVSLFTTDSYLRRKLNNL